MLSRRLFIQGAGSALTLFMLPRRAFAQDSLDLFVTIEADGGWDTTIAMDPKIGPEFHNFFTETDIQRVGDVSFAPRQSGVPYMVGADGARQSFIARYASRLLVINGIDTQTNSHDVGPRHTFSGSVRTNLPALTALHAAISEERQGKLPVAYLSSGGFSSTQELLPTTRSGSLAAFVEASLPNRLYDDRSIVPEQALERARVYERARQARREAAPLLPRMKRDLQRHFSAREVERGFEPVAGALAALPAYTAGEQNISFDLDKARLTAALMSAGVCAAANIHVGGFDTHDGNHDTQQREQLGVLFSVIDHFWRMAEITGIADRVTMMVGSDFSRTLYNEQNGKDHWPISSMMLMGKGVNGGRVVGQTGGFVRADGSRADGHLANKVKVQSGALVGAAEDDPDGFILSPADVHQALRSQLGISQSPLNSRFALETSQSTVLPLLR